MVVVLVMIINFGFGIYSLSKQTVVDEPLWIYDRIPKYWKNIAERDWKGTRISDKPGITVALISGIGLLAEDPKKYDTKNKHYDPEKNIEKLFLTLRLPLFIFTVLMLPVFYFFIRRLLGTATAIFSILFIGLSPILLGISRIINPDSLLWIFMPLTILSYLNYIKNKDQRYLYSTGILLGLSLLTKYVSNILIVFFLGLIFLEYILSKEKIGDTARYIKRSLLDLGKIILIALATFTILFPAVWIKPEKLLGATLLSQAFENTWQYLIGLIVLLIADLVILKSRVFALIFSFFRKIRRYLVGIIVFLFIASILIIIVNAYSGSNFFDFEDILDSPKSSYSTNGFLGLFLSGFYSLFFGMSAIAIFSALIAVLYLLKKNALDNLKNRTAFYFIIFIILYYVGSSANKVAATVRYEISLYPLTLILSGLGMTYLSYLISRKYKRKYLVFSFLTIILLLVSIASLYRIKPFYFSYASSLLPQQYVLNLKDMGDGSYQAARYLNNLPDAKNTTIWTDKRGVCAFFSGKCTSTFDFKRYITEGYKFDYYVVSRGRLSRTKQNVMRKIPYNPQYLIRFDKLYNFNNPIKQFNLAGRESNYVKIIRADQIDISHTQDPNLPIL